MLQISIAKKSGPTSRIPLPTGRYFLNLSPPPGAEQPSPSKTISASNLPTSGNLRPQKSANRRASSSKNQIIDTNRLPSGASSTTPLSPVTQYRSHDKEGRSHDQKEGRSHDPKEGRELYEMPKANATALQQPQGRQNPTPPTADAATGPDT